MMPGSTSELSLAQIWPGRPAFACSISSSICSSSAVLHVDRRERDLLQVLGLGIAGDVVEQPRRIAAQRRIAGEEREIGVDLGGHRMIVAGAEMHIGAHLRALAAHHHRHLGVGLELDEAEHHLRAGALEIAGPLDIGLLVEARLELDQRHHRLARLRRLGQRRDDRDCRSRCGRASA